MQTLSERLLLRDMGPAVAYDGESALEMLKEDEPEVMILDLEDARHRRHGGVAPGQGHPAGHRGDHPHRPRQRDRPGETCMGLGAFAYLQKPVDIDVLSETMKQANEKIQARKQAQQGA